MKNVTIEKVTTHDLDTLDRLYEHARAFMASTNNPNQWTNGFPSRSDLLPDIEKGHFYCIKVDSVIEAAFVFYIGIDPCYNVIYDGKWLNDHPYCVLHRVASFGRVKGLSRVMIDFAKKQIDDVRMDTHADNKVMQRVLEKNGFVHVGTILLANGQPRLAYHFAKD